MIVQHIEKLWTITQQFQKLLSDAYGKDQEHILLEMDQQFKDHYNNQNQDAEINEIFFENYNNLKQ